MENVAQRAIIEYHDFAQVRLDRAQIFDICPISESAMLSIEPAREILPLLLKPIDDWICVFLYGSRENNKVVPFANFSKEIVTMRSFMDVVEDRMLRA